MTEYRIHHLQRSGSHAFVKWLLDSLPNNESKLVINDALQVLITHNSSFLPPNAKIRDFKHRIITLEDCPPIYAHNQLTTCAHILGIPLSTNPSNIVLVRSPYNLFASRYHFQCACMAGDCSREAVALWKIHAHTAIKGKLGNHPCTGVVFDQMVKSKNYRTLIAETLGVSPAPWPKTESSPGQGSSFNDGSVLDRKHHLTNKMLQCLASNVELNKLAKSLHA